MFFVKYHDDIIAEFQQISSGENRFTIDAAAKPGYNCVETTKGECCNVKTELHVVLSVRLFTDEKCFGPGVAQLLHCVEELHSLRSAAISMEMAYSKAWTVIRRAEKELGFALLDSTVGGKNGGGASLTAQGKQLLDAYDEYCKELKTYAAQRFSERFAFLKN